MIIINIYKDIGHEFHGKKILNENTIEYTFLFKGGVIQYVCQECTNCLNCIHGIKTEIKGNNRQSN
ncbi:hypothetical protein LCGC14_2869770 [marine sediment metagenome]|uniref:Uncharacterized protein n=1 Tax=marine sediment metagenome TaxID=412755 RepID=A0A0F9ABG7_9ZZZZ